MVGRADGPATVLSGCQKTRYSDSLRTSPKLTSMPMHVKVEFRNPKLAKSLTFRMIFLNSW